MKKLPRVGIRLKLLSGVLLFIILVSSVLLGVNHLIYTNGVNSIEQADAISDIQRIEGLIKDRIANYLIKVYDWSQWDDSYIFVQDNNQSFIDNNLQNSSLANININFMLFINKEGTKITYGKGVDINTTKDIPIPQNFLSLLKPSIKQASKSENSYSSGMINLSSKPLMFAIRPITHSDGTGPIAGYVLFGRYLDKELTNYISGLNQSTIRILSYDDKNLPEDFKEVKEQISTKGIKSAESDGEIDSYYIKEYSNNRLDIYTIVYDNEEKPLIIIENQKTRPFLALGGKVIQASTLVSIIIAIASLLLSLFMLNAQIISKITRLNKDVTLVKNRNNAKKRLDVKGNDEFADLAANINSMLDSINASEEELKKKSEQLQVEVDSLEKFQKLTVGRELKMIELKKQIVELEEKLKNG